MERLGRLRIVSCSSLALVAGLGLTEARSALAANPPAAAPAAQKPAAAAAPAPAAVPAPAAAPAAAPGAAPATAAPPAPAAAPASAPAAQTTAAAAPAAAATTPPPPAPAAAPAAAPPAAEPAPAQEEKLPPVDVGVWLRAAGRLQGSDPKNLDAAALDTAYAELHASGKVHKNVSLTLNLNANGVAGTAAIEDAIIGFDMMDQAHVWIGQLLVPVDRANFSGPFFMIPWNYPGFVNLGVNQVVMAPIEGPTGRNTGASFWGNDPDGKIKYAVGVFVPPPGANVALNPLVSGRVSAAIIGKETGYFGNESFFGDQDIVSIGVGGQYKKDGSVGPVPPPAMPGVPPGPAPTDTWGEFNADALGEFRYGGGGWVSVDAAYYHFAGNENAITDTFYATAAVATPKVGVGNIQPMVRYQFGAGNGNLGNAGVKVPNVSTIDAAVAYLVRGPGLRLMVNFQHADIGNGIEGNMLQFGAQGIVF